MIDSQLGPPMMVAASRGGSAPPGAAAGDVASAAGTQADDGSFTAALEGRRASASSDARPTKAHNPSDAAGPQTGELQEEDAAEAGASQETTTAAQIATAIAALATAVAPTVASATPPSGAAAGQQVAEVIQASGPPQPIAGLVPAQLDGKGGVMPAPTAAQAQAQAQASAQAPVAALAQGSVVTQASAQDPTAATAGADVLSGAAPVPAPAGPTPAASATLTLTITPVAAKDAAAPVLDPALATPVVAAQATAPVAVATAAEDHKGAPAAASQVPDAATAVAKAVDPPAGSIAPAPAPAPAHTDPLTGAVRPDGGFTTPHELARELGSRVHMAVREGGRELVVNLRPADLGHLTIRVTMTDGVMQASIIADRPEAARMLQQSLGHLDTALSDLGYSLDNLDVAYSGQDPRDAQASSQKKEEDAVVRGEVLEADGTPAVSGTTTSSGAGSAARLDILA
jgi:flagellar hook-length control protein FliK